MGNSELRVTSATPNSSEPSLDFITQWAKSVQKRSHLFQAWNSSSVKFGLSKAQKKCEHPPGREFLLAVQVLTKDDAHDPELPVSHIRLWPFILLS